MATEECWREGILLRSSRRCRPITLQPVKPVVVKKEAEPVEEVSSHVQIQEHKSEQINPRHEKDTLTPPNNQQTPLTILEGPVRRQTRSFTFQARKITSQPQLPLELVTPEDKPRHEEEEDNSCRQMVGISSVGFLSEGGSPEMVGTFRKAVSRIESLVSPYSEVRKSYRKNHKKEIVSIPYRKCHDPFQGRIVSIINKIEGGKNWMRDVESLIDKIQKITPKDMTNRFIVAGIRTISRLTHHAHAHDPLLNRMNHEISALDAKIQEELERTDDFEQKLHLDNQQFIDAREYRRKTIRRVYRLLKTKEGARAREMRDKVISDCEVHFKSDANVGALISLIRTVTV